MELTVASPTQGFSLVEVRSALYSCWAHITLTQICNVFVMIQIDQEGMGLRSISCIGEWSEVIISRHMMCSSMRTGRLNLELCCSLLLR